ncbi:MAG TPA: histidine kinase [Gemmatimonadales bacterium]
MSRAGVWVQLIVAWLPVWVLYSTMIVAAHEGTSFFNAAMIGLRAIACAAVLGLGVYRFTERFPWPHPIRWRFVAAHLVAAPLYAITWVVLTNLVEVVLHVRPHDPGVVMIRLPLARYLVMGFWLYLTVTGVAYTLRAAERAARAEAAAVRAQLAALRGQLNPHFLFNALHSVVQLIPTEPSLAARAAEQVAGLLRTTLEEERDLVSLGEEWDFVERYLAVERIRFGDRLRVRAAISGPAREASLPSFALQTLVENAVRHGVEPKVGDTLITVDATLRDGRLTVEVRDDGAGMDGGHGPGSGTGLARLRERLAGIYGAEGQLDARPDPVAGFRATLVVPQDLQPA